MNILPSGDGDDVEDRAQWTQLVDDITRDIAMFSDTNTIAVGVNEDGTREVFGIAVGDKKVYHTRQNKTDQESWGGVETTC